MINPLTSLRFFFALMVFFSHLEFLKESNSPLLQWMYNNFFIEGFMGVSFFFILSGFILSYNYQALFLNNQLSIKKFLKARFARIYPLHFITFIVAIPLTYKAFMSDSLTWMKTAFLNLTLVQSFIPDLSTYFSFNGPSWSISDEMFFYLMFPFLISFLFRSKNWIIIFILLVILIPVLSFSVEESISHWMFYINPITRLVDFIIGMSLFRIFNFIKNKEFISKINFTYIEVVSIVILSLFVLVSSNISMVARFSYYYWFPMIFLILVFSFQGGKISKILSKKYFIYLGEISFGFYLIHHLVIKYYISANNYGFIFFKNQYIIVILLLLITLILSHFSFIKYEKPINKYLKKKWIS